MAPKHYSRLEPIDLSSTKEIKRVTYRKYRKFRHYTNNYKNGRKPKE